MVAGIVFGAINLAFTWLDPVEDDTPSALLLFYGPMFLVWAFAAYRAARRTGKFTSGVFAGLTVAFATFCVYDLLVLLRVNLFLDELTKRADWQNMVARFRRSSVDSLRLFVNLDYLKGAPFKIAVASTIGAVMGTMAGALAKVRRAT
jgi:hypothetical protein